MESKESFFDFPDHVQIKIYVIFKILDALRNSDVEKLKSAYKKI